MTVNDKKQQQKACQCKYVVEAKVKAFQDGGSLYNVNMFMLRGIDNYKELPTLLDRLGYPRDFGCGSDKCEWPMDNDLFSEKEAYVLVKFLNSLDGFQASLNRNGGNSMRRCFYVYGQLDSDDHRHVDISRYDGYPMNHRIYGHYMVGSHLRVAYSNESILRQTENLLKGHSTENKIKLLQKMLDQLNENTIG